MRSHQIKRIIKAPTTQLAATYLAIILFMSVSFSVVLYNTSSQQLGRQLPPDSFFRQHTTNQTVTQTETGAVTTNVSQPSSTQSREEVNKFLQARIDEGRSDLIRHLAYLNLSVLILGIVVSYALARRSLEPLEASMEAQALFVSDASHELRTPLTAIQTSNEVFLRRQKITVTDAKALIEQNTEDVKRLKQLSDALLNLAKQDKTNLELKLVEVQTLISEAITQIVPQATEKSITVEDKTANVAVLGNQAALAQVLVILLDNAVKYSATDTKVTLSTQVKGKHTCLVIKDRGIGIRASDIPHLFRRFYRADSARTDGATNGYGLGLAIAKQIVESNHGTIDVVSTPGKGSTFSVKLITASKSTK
jgi:two-component system sensor histidine kinase CiaH